MALETELKAAFDTLHQTVVEDIANEDILLQRILNAGDNTTLIQSLIKQAQDDNTALRSEIDKTKAAVSPTPA